MGLDSVELLIEIENEFQIEISNIEAENIITIGDFHKTISQKIDLTKTTEEAIFQKLREVVSDKVGFDIDEIHYQTKIVDDLRID